MLVDAADIGTVGHHGVLDVQGDDFAGEFWEGDVEVDSG